MHFWTIRANGAEEKFSRFWPILEPIPEFGSVFFSKKKKTKTVLKKTPRRQYITDTVKEPRMVLIQKHWYDSGFHCMGS